MIHRQQNYGVLKGKPRGDVGQLEEGAYYLTEIDDKWRRYYKMKPISQVPIVKNAINFIERIRDIDKKIPYEAPKFYKMSVPERREALGHMTGVPLDTATLEEGGLNTKTADSMIENVIGRLSLPLGVLPSIKINQQKFTVPMCI